MRGMAPRRDPADGPSTKRRREKRETAVARFVRRPDTIPIPGVEHGAMLRDPWAAIVATVKELGIQTVGQVQDARAAKLLEEAAAMEAAAEAAELTSDTAQQTPSSVRTPGFA